MKNQCPQTDRIVEDALKGLPAKVIAKMRNVPYPTVTYIIKKFTETVPPERRIRKFIRCGDQYEMDL